MAPSFHAALADYVSKSIYHTIEMTIRGRVDRLVRESGFYMAVERRRLLTRVDNRYAGERSVV